MNEQKKAMQVYFGTKGNNGEWIPHFYEIRASRIMRPRATFTEKASRDAMAEYPPEFNKFLQQNRERETILADIGQILEKWFVEGVTYSERSPGSWLAGVPAYNLPQEVYESLEKCQLRIALSILRHYHAPLRLCPEIFMERSAKKLGGKRELGAEFKIIYRNPVGPPIGLMWAIKDMLPKEAAKFVAKIWYENHALRLWHSLSKISLRVLNEDAGIKSLRAIEKAMEVEQRLRDMEYTDIEIIAYYAYEQRFTETEQALLSNELSNDVKSPDTIRKNHDRIKAKLREIEKKT